MIRAVMKPIKKISIGSSVFFNRYEDYNSKDVDILAIMDDFISGSDSLNMKLNDSNEDVFMYRNLSKEQFINDCLRSKVPMRAGKFLVPEFVEYIHLTINDLKQLEPLFESMDEKHTYEKIIYDAYIENNDFVLTDEQRLEAYKEYKRNRRGGSRRNIR